MTPTIIDSDTGRILWRSAECADHCGLALRTWSSYVSHGHAPAAIARLDARTPLWDAEEVKGWQRSRSSRRGS